jgi:hypothetical protein
VKQLTRTGRAAIIALALALVAAAGPVAASTPPAAVPTPIRIAHHVGTGFTIPAGYACSFEVAGVPDWGFSAHTYFPDGSIRSSVRAHGAYVNTETGAEFPTADNFYVYEVFPAGTNLDIVFIAGQATSSFLPGDDGPFGTVTEASFYKFVGTFWFTYHLDTGQQTDFGYRGTVEDVCAALS